MKASQFNILTPYDPTGELLAFNTANGALTAFPQSVTGVVRDILSGAVPVAQADPRVLQLLTDQGYLVVDNAAEVDQVLGRIGMGITDTNRLDVFILPNMDCNLACPYCFEDHSSTQMDEDVEERIVQWFEQMAPLFKVVLISWFGGEPLLSYPTILRLQRRLRQICEDAGTHLSAHITTNGFQLSRERAAALCELGVLSYQITIDGPPDVHNATRMRRGGGPSFDRIFDNLCSLARTQERASIKLRVNFDASTIGRIPELLERFPEDVRPSLHLVLERIFGQPDAFIGMTTTQIAQDTERLYDLARSLGFAVTTTTLGPDGLTYCYADRENQFVFNHTGDVFKCTVSRFTRAERLGYLRGDGAIQWEGEHYQQWMGLPAIDEECRSCTYLPMCLGGCRKNRAEGGHASADCTLPFAALDLRIRQKYESTLEPVTSHKKLLPIQPV